ncbi:hypothetical protein CEXT_167401 [Caerostris extrusa]|uniref:Uncharacterized protein n=1 Tax=Caerostris extrusa TaxID=172846 RepID=A0AAV4W5G9_CAEEX|nr:hypothetical protein CEXT_167401 [Caerostris extrusa]
MGTKKISNSPEYCFLSPGRDIGSNTRNEQDLSPRSKQPAFFLCLSVTSSSTFLKGRLRICLRKCLRWIYVFEIITSDFFLLFDHLSPWELRKLLIHESADTFFQRQTKNISAKMNMICLQNLHIFLLLAHLSPWELRIFANSRKC